MRHEQHELFWHIGIWRRVIICEKAMLSTHWMDVKRCGFIFTMNLVLLLGREPKTL
jgi:hypothetical protein